MSKNIYRINLLNEKSRRDGILLTAGFNPWTRSAAYPLQSPEGTTFCRDKVSSLRDLRSRSLCSLRRLKPTVNKVSSLRDFDGYAVPQVRRLKSTVNNMCHCVTLFLMTIFCQ